MADLSNRGVPNDAVAGELQLAWWTTAFEDIVKSSAIISNQDGSAMQSAADRFTQVDVEHVRSIGPMVAQESVRRLCDMLFSRTQEANLLHTTLAGSRNVPLNRLRREHPQILAAAKPILVATPATLAAITDPAPLADTVIIDTGRAYSVHRAAQHHRPREAGRGDRAPQDRHIRWPAATDRTAAKREDNRQAGSPCAEAQRLP